MTAILAAILPLIQTVVTKFPEIKEGLKNILNKKDPTDSDWANLRGNILAKNYEDYVPTTKLPKDAP